MSLGRCKRRGCWSPLVDRMDNLGRLVVGCPKCARNKEGRCADGPHRLERPRAIRCNACAKARNLALDCAAKRRKYRTNEAYRQHELEYHRGRRSDPAFLKREAEWAERRKRRPAVRTESDRHFERIRRKVKTLSREAKDRHNASRRQKYATDPAWRAKKLAVASKHRRSGKHKPLTPDQRRRRNDHMRERYATDQAWREKRQANGRDCVHRARHAEQAPNVVGEISPTPIAQDESRRTA